LLPEIGTLDDSGARGCLIGRVELDLLLAVVGQRACRSRQDCAGEADRYRG
jgi:hypothetical protein